MVKKQAVLVLQSQRAKVTSISASNMFKQTRKQKKQPEWIIKYSLPQHQLQHHTTSNGGLSAHRQSMAMHVEKELDHCIQKKNTLGVGIAIILLTQVHRKATSMIVCSEIQELQRNKQRYYFKGLFKDDNTKNKNESVMKYVHIQSKTS